MRLIRKKLYRAFPELDRFSDEQCRRFISSANSSWSRLLGENITFVAGLIGVISAIYATSGVVFLLGKLARAGAILTDLVAIVALAAGFVLGLFTTIALNDYLQRLNLRRLIHRCGTCPKCRYSLLGIRVARDHSVTCPECGLKVDVDPALGDLATDETGAAVYKPEVARVHKATPEARRRRHRRFLKWTGITIASVVLLIASAAGVWWLVLEGQANPAPEPDGSK